MDSLEFHWRTLVPLELELYLSSTGVPLENLRSAWGCSWGCSWTLPSCATARGMSRSPNSWMRQCRESELDREFWLVEDPSQCKPTTWSDKVVVTFEQNCSLRFLLQQVHFDSILSSILVRFWPRSSPNFLYKSTFSKVPLAKSPREGYACCSTKSTVINKLLIERLVTFREPYKHFL